LLGCSSQQVKGRIYFVGAGPGDPDLLTVKAVRILGLADVVLHDALVSTQVLALVSSRARIINVGKRCGRKSITQDEINELLLRFGLSGEVVVRLKSGDPLIFARAGEELEVVQRAGVEVEIVPGVTAALAAAAAVQTSLTDRRTADQTPGHQRSPRAWKRQFGLAQYGDESYHRCRIHAWGVCQCGRGPASSRAERLYSVRRRIKSIKRGRTAVSDHSRAASPRSDLAVSVRSDCGRCLGNRSVSGNAVNMFTECPTYSGRSSAFRILARILTVTVRLERISKPLKCGRTGLLV
jgi:precorrin-6B methylase 1